MAQLLQRFFFISQRFLQLDENGTVDSFTLNYKKIITLLIPATVFQAGKGKTFNVDRRGTCFYANYNH